MVGVNSVDLVHPEDIEEVKQKRREFEGKDVAVLSCRYRRKDGAYTWVETILKNIRDLGTGEIIELHAASRDITERKNAENILSLRQRELEASNKELEAFCYTISHDLRSPLRAIDGFGGKLDEEYGQTLDYEGQRLLHVVRDNAQKMGILIDSLLEFSRLNKKSFRKYTFPMHTLVSQVLEECGQQMPEYFPEVVLHELADSAGDKELLHQVWHNLIANAFKFTSKKEAPKIEIGSITESSEVIYYIKDNGAGFDMTYKSKLFGVFQRLHAANEFHGTGVGLATVQRIVHRHGGKVWAEGAPGEGAQFNFSLPSF
jgi:light-regulated signal transduction histidine kinase (bacteriophytochrome)